MMMGGPNGLRARNRNDHRPPPFTSSTCPLHQPEDSDAKNITAFAMSAAVPSRRIAVPSTIWVFRSSL